MFAGDSVVMNLPADAGNTGSIPRLGRFPEKERATHYSILAWDIPWTVESSGLQSVGSQRVGHDWPTEGAHARARTHTHTHTHTHVVCILIPRTCTCVLYMDKGTL